MITMIKVKDWINFLSSNVPLSFAESDNGYKQLYNGKTFDVDSVPDEVKNRYIYEVVNRNYLKKDKNVIESLIETKKYDGLEIVLR